MALGFSSISSDPLSALPTLFVFFNQEVYFLAQFVDPVAFLTADPTKRLVFAIELTVVPLTGEAVPTLGTEIISTP